VSGEEDDRHHIAVLIETEIRARMMVLPWTRIDRFLLWGIAILAVVTVTLETVTLLGG
jgi:hypothetical protein